MKLEWFKNVVYYEINVKAFQDSNDDGIGDFKGLTNRLDYIKDLGIGCLWLMPMYPSPLRDDGYDISDYKSIHPDLGSLSDFKNFLEEAHKRSIRVIVDLVMNHTSEMHYWFQEAIKGEDNLYHHYYVWSHTDKKYKNTRIIFIDTEKSNWTFNKDVGKYYWHRFFSHQPDLNYDNPKVQEEILDIVRYWLNMGIDGFRVDAIPYLFEREGTSNENLPETHEFVKKIRKVMDREYPNAILLAEANQEPKALLEYFGNGDEFHMAYNFPLMPAMFMALKKEDSAPIINILKKTPSIPQNCQWMIFLRNHDELTLEIVSEEDRNYMLKAYAPQKRMKSNLGIRRRLLPLLDGNIQVLKLLNAMLFSMPGSPIIYYGDEIGMGENIYLNDRDGVRTPMQWDSGKNGGFSRAEPEDLILPMVNDPDYSFRSVNVLNQTTIPSSIFNFMKKLIQLRQSLKALNVGSIKILSLDNNGVLAFIRQFGEHRIVCIFNLTQTTHECWLPLGEYSGFKLKDCWNGDVFPDIENDSYHIKLDRYKWLFLDLFLINK